MSPQRKPLSPAPVPQNPTLPKLRNAAATCTACDLYRDATQTVFGDGPRHADVMLVGEQPGDKEDLEGEPFVGPAGKLLDKALAQAGIDRATVYVTNAVKHFKFVRKGKRRIHQKPNAYEQSACRPWLDAEIAVVKPRVVLALGATAAQQLLGRSFRLTQHRGELVEVDAPPLTVMATVHPSSILRAPDDQTRREETEAFVRDLRKLARYLKKTA